MSNQERFDSLLLWMEEREITYIRLARLMGVSDTFVRTMLKRDTIPSKRHGQLVELGVPEDLLPTPFTGSFGRPRNAV